MESVWKAQTARWEPPAFQPPTGRAKRMHHNRAPDHHPTDKKIKPSMGHRTVLDEWLDKPCQIHTAPNYEPTHRFRACWVLRQVAKSGEDLLIQNTSEHHPVDDNTILTVFETFASNNRRKRALRSLAEVCHVGAINPWSDTAITFNASDEPKF